MQNKASRHDMRAKIDAERLIIQRYNARHWRDLHEYLSDPEVVKYEPYDVCDEKQCKREVKRRAKDSAFWAVILKSSGKEIGNVYLAEQEYDTFTLGYVFNRNYWKMGYATEAARAMVNYAFEMLGAHRIVATCDTKNDASWRLLERLGMRKEGCFVRNAYFKLDFRGKALWHDTYQYAMLRDEWSGR